MQQVSRALTFEALIDIIYDAAFGKRTWDDAAAALGQYFDVITCTISFARIVNGNLSWIPARPIRDPKARKTSRDFAGAYNLPPEFVQEIPSEDYNKNLSTPVTSRDSAILTLLNGVLSSAKNLRSEFYYDSLRSGTEMLFAGAVSVPLSDDVDGYIALFGLVKSSLFPLQNQEELKKLVTHLRRAGRYFMALEEARERAGSLEMMIDSTGRGMAIVDASGTLKFANSIGNAALHKSGAFILARGGQIRSHNNHVTERFLSCLQNVRTENQRSAANDMVIPFPRSSPERLPVIVQVSPVNLDQTITNGGLLIIQDPEVKPALNDELLKACFGFTPAEIRLVDSLRGGKSLREAAAAQKISYSTARTQLLSIFAKAGVNRQADLMTLLEQMIIK